MGMVWGLPGGCLARATVAWQPEVERYNLDVSKVDAGPESCWWDDWGHKGVVWVSPGWALVGVVPTG